MPAPRLIRWLTLLALFLAPLAMIGGGPAMAHEPMAVSGHCSEEDGPRHAPLSGAPADCMIACAGVLMQGDAYVAKPRPARVDESSPAAFRLDGLHPEAATPPPRPS